MQETKSNWLTIKRALQLVVEDTDTAKYYSSQLLIFFWQCSLFCGTNLGMQFSYITAPMTSPMCFLDMHLLAFASSSKLFDLDGEPNSLTKIFCCMFVFFLCLFVCFLSFFSRSHQFYFTRSIYSASHLPLVIVELLENHWKR